jgi:photosystem II stability/assembly factor-like uncharacterized protein
MVFYFGACVGGVWKTEDGGTFWENISDGFLNTASVGAIAVADSDPNVVYAGTGEACIRGNLSHGDGVYRSTDGGKTWSHRGLEDTRHIGRVRVHPQDPDLVYVAALGHAFGPNDQRGVFRSRDGGESWERTLFKSENAGAVDLSMDPTNPRVLFATIWQARREPWTFSSGGPDSSLHRSTDGGDTWTDITENQGLPGGVKGRIGVAVSPSRQGRVWAVVEAQEGGLFRSDDGGDTWERVSDDRNLVQRAWYYSHVFADPQDAETVYILNLKAWKSVDGGRTFEQITTPHGDNHDLWIDPNDSTRMIEGNDGGACVSFNSGESWSTIYNQPTSQFYHLTTDEQFPYRVYGTQQDNSAISVPSRSPDRNGIPWGDCYTVGFSESGHIAVRPDDANIVYSGAIGSSPGGGDSLMRYDHRLRQSRIVSVWPELVTGLGPKDHRYRFQWTYPIVISPHDPDVLYVAANVLFRSIDEGENWEEISPDLTRNEVEKLGPSGGEVTLDTTYVEHYATIFAFTESPHEKGLFWAGSDDGLVHISRDGGATWDNVTPPDLPEWTRIDVVEVSPHDPATAYVSATRYKLDDNRPFLYKTNDYGGTWTRITHGIPDDDFTRVIREDSVRRGLLYAGTELGIYVSLDDGGSWTSLRGDMPVVPVTDLVVKREELVAATNGRSFWLLGDLALLRQVADGSSGSGPRLFEPSPTYRVQPATAEPTPGKSFAQGVTFYETRLPSGERERRMLDAGANPPEGVVVHYLIDEATDEDVTLTFLDSDGEAIRAFTSKVKEGSKDPVVPTRVGMNRFVWDTRYPGATAIEGEGVPKEPMTGPVAPPGRYQVMLSVGDRSQTRSLELLADPRGPATQRDLQAQFDLLARIRDRLSATHEAVNSGRRIRRQVDEWTSRASARPDAASVLAPHAKKLKDKLEAIEDKLFDPKTVDGMDRLGRPGRLSAKLSAIGDIPSFADYAPTTQTYEVFETIAAQVDEQLAALQDVIDGDVAEFAGLVHELEIPAILVETAS